MRSKNKPITIIGFVLMLSMLLVMGGLCLAANIGQDDSNPVVVFYGVEGIPETSLTNSLHAAGFDYCVQEAYYSKDGYTFELDSDLEDRDLIVVGSGDCAVYTIGFFENHYSNVKGYVLLDPVSQGALSLEGLSNTFPDSQVAIFAGRDNAKDISEMSDARVIFERLSGVDSFYGAGFRVGALFPSLCYSNASQDRYLSLSSFDSKNGSMVSSPIFQSEFASFLTSTFDDICTPSGGAGRIAIWYALSAIAPLFAITGMCMFISLFPTNKTGMRDDSEGRNERMVFRVLSIITLVIIIGTVVFSISEYLRRSVLLILIFIPVVYLVIMSVSSLKLFFDNRIKFVTNHGDIVRNAIIVSSELVFAILCCILYFGLFSIDIEISSIILSLIIAVIDFGCVALLSYVDKKSRFAGNSGSSYFGNKVMPALILIPSVFVLMFGIICSMDTVIFAGLSGVLIAIAPLLLTLPVRRHTDSSVLVGLVHAITYFLLFICLL